MVNGIYEKYRVGEPTVDNHHYTSEGSEVSVNRTDGRSNLGDKHHGCRYFVLDVDWNNPATTAALKAYATECESTYPCLASDLNEIAEDCTEAEMSYFILDLDHDPFAAPAVAAFETVDGCSVASVSAPTPENDEQKTTD